MRAGTVTEPRPVRGPVRWLWGAGLALAALAVGVAAESRAAWTTTTWNGESAREAVAGPWRAVVSIERARLMYFGPAERDENLLLAPPTRANRNLLGGHRLWLGPQVEWPKIWPPPEAWEYEQPESVEEQNGQLRLRLRDAGGGWPRLTRTYEWKDGRLVCGAESRGGTHAAQFVQILQVPPDTAVVLQAQREPDFPAGYAQLAAGGLPFTGAFTPHPHVQREGDTLTLRLAPAILKVGARPQTIVAQRPGYRLSVARGAVIGRVVDAPDQGFFTQIYLGGRESFIELEQLSPRFAAGKDARFEIEVSAEPHPL